MRIAIRFVIPLLSVLLLIAWGASPLLGELIHRWFRADVELRSQLVFDSVNDSVVHLLTDSAGQRIDLLFQRLSRDERLLAVGLCDRSGQLVHRSTSWPKTLVCLPRTDPRPLFRVEPQREGAVLVAAFPLRSGAQELGDLIIVHDLSFIDRRAGRLEGYLTLFIAVLGILIAGASFGVARFMLRSWVRAVCDGLAQGEQTEPARRDAEPEIARLVGEMREMIRDLDVPRGLSEAIRVDWNPDTLRNLLRSELPEAEVIVVSNREPYIHNRDDEAVHVQRPASGLVTALEPIVRACGGTWIAHGSGSADAETVDRHDRIQVPPEAPDYRLRRIWLTDEEQDGYYYGLANEGLWPLCHVVFVRPVFRPADWEQYVAVNRKFADAVVSEARSRNPVVLVQDYHFALLPQMVRERLPGATIITFWHIPWPNPEVFGICPWREEILRGLLGSTILGFHTQFHCLNFLDSVDRLLECRIDREQSTARAGGRMTLVRPYPISIEWPPAALVGQPPVPKCREAVRRDYGLAPDLLLAVGVERSDYTKGIADRFRAVEDLLETHPEWIGRFSLLQIAAPTRSRLPSYRQTQAETEAAASAVNQRFGRPGWLPILLVSEHREPEQVFTLFRSADLCLVSSLHDGMNLVAKEFVAARDDEDGVLILSSFAGVSRELLEAIIVNPYDSHAMGEAIHQALLMPRERRRERMRLMRALVSEHNIYFWAGRMLLEAARLRKRQQIEDRMGQVSSPFLRRLRGGV